MKTSMELHWEWPEGRTPTQKFQVRVDKIKKTSRGLFGYKKSASCLFNYPDSIDLNGLIISNDEHTRNKTLTIILPLEAIKNINEGDIIEIGIVDSPIVDSKACISVSLIDNR